MSTWTRYSSASLVLVLLVMMAGAVLVFGQSSGAADDADGAVEAVSASATPTEHLGWLLFWDPILSGSRDTACASCHHPDFAYADGRELSRGTGAVGIGPDRTDRSGGAIPIVRRNSPTILNTAFNGVGGGRGRGRRGGAIEALLNSDAVLNADSVNAERAPMFWDNRVRSLEAQALEPIKAFEEMRGSAYAADHALETVVARLKQIPGYVDLFTQAFGETEPITAEHIGQAIAAFERTLVAANSPFDRFRAGDMDAMTAQQQRGMREFDQARCARCHGGLMFSDFRLHAEGVAEHAMVAEPDSGAGRFRFRTPTLRNIALTAPYMHNGTLATLKDVLDFYDNGQSLNPNVSSRGGRGGRGGRDGGGPDQNEDGLARLDRDFRGVRNMSDQDKADIIAFLEALTDTDFDRSIPATVPSGLAPGGN